MSQETKQCQNCHKDFTIEPEDFQFYEKIKVPPPTFCPQCRMIRRFIFRNAHNLFRHKDEITGKDIFSNFPPQVKAKIYEVEYWNSDAWDPVDYGRDYDFSRSFFEQFNEFLYEVPWPSRSVLRLVNSDYSDQCGGFKNCYLCFNGDDFENSAYVITGYLAKECFDLYETRKTELSYEGYMVDDSYKVFYSVNCEECHDVWFSRNMVGCQNCFGCVNLRNKNYYIFNKKVTKEQYEKFMEGFNSGSHEAVEAMKKKAYSFWMKNPMKYALLINTVNSTGEHIERSKNIKFSYGVHEGQDLAYCQNLSPPVSDSYDYTTWGVSASKMYEAITCGEEVSDIKFSRECWPSSRDIEYSTFCRSSSDLFGCVGLKKKQYCIFNKQYEKQEYFALRDKIINHMNEMPFTDKRGNIYKYGEFFPPEFSPFAYNETIAQDFFPLTKERAENKGYLWREQEQKEFNITVDSKDLSDNIKDVSDDILREIIKCSKCGNAYRIIQMELTFLKRIGLPLPRMCHNCRFKERLKFVNPPKFYKGKCQCAGGGDDSGVYQNTATHSSHQNNEHCPNEFQTSYAQGRPEILYCEACYQQEVI